MRLPTLVSFLPSGLDAVVSASMKPVVSSKLGRDDRAAGGWPGRLAAAERLPGVHPQPGDGVLRGEAQRQHARWHDYPRFPVAAPSSRT